MATAKKSGKSDKATKAVKKSLTPTSAARGPDAKCSGKPAPRAIPKTIINTIASSFPAVNRV